MGQDSLKKDKYMSSRITIDGIIKAEEKEIEYAVTESKCGEKIYATFNSLEEAKEYVRQRHSYGAIIWEQVRRPLFYAWQGVQFIPANDIKE